MAWQFNSREPVFLQIANKLRVDILRGKYSPDEQFPSVRQLAFEAAVNPNTMQKALAFLEEEGILHSRGTIGRFVTSDESVLSSARESMKRDMIRSWVEESLAMGITKEDLIRYFEEEEGKV